MGAIGSAKALLGKVKKKQMEQAQNRKSTDTKANSSANQKTVYYKAVGNAAPKHKKTAGPKQAVPKYYRGAGNVAKAAQAIRAKAPNRKVNFGEDLSKDNKVLQIENYTPQYRVNDERPFERMKIDLAPGSGYRMRNWINGRANNQPEDKGSTLAQANRLASLYGAIYPTTKGYTPEQASAIQAQARNAPVALQDLFIKNTGNLKAIKDIWPDDRVYEPGENTAYFSRNKGRVYADQREVARETGRKIPFQTHWHEYGHNLDWLAGGNGRFANDRPMYSVQYGRTGSNLGDTISADIDQSLQSYWENVRGNPGPYNADVALGMFIDDMYKADPYTTKNSASLSDVMGPYSVQHGGSAYPLGYGHNEQYWNSDPRKLAKEAFADLTSAAVLGGRPRRYVQAILPNTYDTYLDMVARMAGKR